MSSAPLFTLLSAVAVLLYAVGFHYLVYSPKDRSCGMTYMYEYPQFAKIAMSEEVTATYKRYSLWAYSEGHHIDAMRKMKFTGIPLLFIPGSGGSHKQGRSLASVCMRKALNSRSSFHMDFFTVDLNEEYSALYGGVLEAQTEFVRQSILRILELYKGNKSNQPSSVVLVGHSMSGLIAKGIFNDPSFNPNLVQVIFTFATPHSRPVILFDEYSSLYYKTTSKTWRSERGNTLSHITLTSVGGGHMDYLVQSDSVASWEIDVHTISTAVPTVWRSVDHLAILWCKELVLVTARMLFDMVDLETKQISTDKDLRNSIVSYHLLHRNAGKQFRKSLHHQYVTFQDGAEWIEPLSRQLSISGNIDPNGKDRLIKPKNVMIRLVDHPQHAILAVEAINHQEGDWVFACQANVIVMDSRVCESGENLSNVSMFWPSLKHKRKRAVLDLSALHQQRKFSHVILRMPVNNEPIQFNIDVHANRILKPPSLGFWMLYDTRPVVLEKETVSKALRYVVDFSEVESLWHVLNLVVKPVSCLKKEHQAVLMMVVPWNNEKVFSFVNELRSDPLLIRLLHVKPRMPRDTPKHVESSMGVKAEISLDPSCTYSISLEATPGSLFSQFVRSLTPCVFAYIVAILLLILREQLLSLKRTGQCSLFHLAMSRGAKPFYILPLCKILTRIFSQSDDYSPRHIISLLGIPEPGMNLMARTPMENLIYPFVLYLCAFGLVYLAGFLVMLGIVFNAKVISAVTFSVVGRFFKRSIASWLSPFNLSEFFLEFMLKAPPILVGLLLILAYTSCGALGLVIGGVYFYAILCNMYNDYLEALFMYSVRVMAGTEKISLDGIANPSTTRQMSLKSKEKRKSEKVELQRNDNRALTAPANDNEIENKKVDRKEIQKDDVKDSGNDDHSSLSDINVYMTVFFIYVCAVIPSIPSLLVWAHNYHYDHSLSPDPIFYPFFTILMSTASTFWIHAYPDPALPCYKIIADCLFALATFTLLYGPTRISFIPFVVCGVMVLLAAHQWLTALFLFFFPPTSKVQTESENESDADSINDNHGDSSHSPSDDEVADGDDEGGESGSNSDYNEGTNDTEKKKAYAFRKISQPTKQESEDDSSDAEMQKDGNMKDT